MSEDRCPTCPTPPARFNDLADEIHEWAHGQGFYDREFFHIPAIPGPRYHVPSADPLDADQPARDVPNPSLPAEKLMLIVSECAEALEALRDEDGEHEAEEIADVLIRVLDYASWRSIDLDRVVGRKMAKNRQRPRLHGRRF